MGGHIKPGVSVLIALTVLGLNFGPMKKNMSGNYRAFLPVVLIFILINAFLLIWNKRLEAAGVNTGVVQAGNLLLFGIFMATALLQRNALRDRSTHVFLRNVYGGMLLKLFGCAIAAFVYIYLNRETVNKPALFGCMFLYLLYTFIELRIVLKQPKAS